jgi:hypothetical protein
MSFVFWGYALKYTFPPDMVDYIYGGFTGTVDRLISRFKLRKPATDVRKEEHTDKDKDVEINVEIQAEKRDNSVYTKPGSENNNHNQIN